MFKRGKSAQNLSAVKSKVSKSEAAPVAEQPKKETIIGIPNGAEVEKKAASEKVSSSEKQKKVSQAEKQRKES